jgi:hypothetical protein
MANRVNIGAKGSQLDWDNWGKPMTDAVNDYENRIAVLESQRLLAYGLRTTNGTTTTTTEQGYMRLDGVPIISGQTYRIWTSPFIMESSVANDLLTCPIRVNTSGAATTGSTQITGLADTSFSASLNQRTKSITVLYIATVTGALSILLSYVRSNGSGNVRINASSIFPAQLAIEAMGANPGNTGVSI